MTGRLRLMTVAVAVGVAVAAIAVGSQALAGSSSGVSNVKEQLSGFEEDPLVLSTTGGGTFTAHIDEGNQEITYELSYSALEGNVLQAHIHFGGKAQSGGISVFLCTNLGNGPAGTQLCPAAPATITGTIRPADVIGPDNPGPTVKASPPDSSMNSFPLSAAASPTSTCTARSTPAARSGRNFTTTTTDPTEAHRRRPAARVSCTAGRSPHRIDMA